MQPLCAGWRRSHHARVWALKCCRVILGAWLHAGINASPTNVKASPIFIDISPNVKVVPNSNKAPTYSAGIAIKPNPDPPTVTNEYGKVQTGPSSVLDRAHVLCLEVCTF